MTLNSNKVENDKRNLKKNTVQLYSLILYE